MSKKGSYIFLVNAQTTAEFMADESIYPAYSILFEILEDGKFKMRMSDGVHKFADLPYIMTNCDAKVVTDTAEEYRIEFSTPWEKFITPNLRARNGQRVATIDHVPGETDLTYTEEGVEYSWTIGDCARYYDESIGSWRFFRLMDITSENAAVWDVADNTFIGEDITINLSTNQSTPENYCEGVKVILSYENRTENYVYDGTPIRTQLPDGTEYTVSVSDLNGSYATPEPQRRTALKGCQRTINMEFKAEKVVINSTSIPEGEDISEKIVTLALEDGTTLMNEPYGEGGLTCLVPFGAKFSVTTTRLNGYYIKKYTHEAALLTREIDLVWEPIPQSYLLIDTTDCTTARVSLLQPEKLNMILAKVKGCMMKPKEDGAKICYLSDSNNNKYSTGEIAVSGDEGDLMTYLPDVYYLYENIGNGQVRYAITDERPDDEYHLIPACLIGQVKAAEIDGVLRSVAGYTPVSGKSYNELLAMATARGEGFGMIDYEAHCLLGMLMYAKYQTTDLQATIGASKAYYDQDNTTGTTLHLGATDSQPAVTDEEGNVTTAANYTTYNRALNIEGIFGGLYEYMQGCKWLDGVWYVTDRDGTERAVHTPYVYTGWIRAMALEDGPRFDMIPQRTDNGSSSTFYADFCEMVSGEYIATNAARGCFSDKQSGDFPDDGIGYINATNTGNIQSEFYSTRIAYYGAITVIDSVSDYLAL